MLALSGILLLMPACFLYEFAGNNTGSNPPDNNSGISSGSASGSNNSVPGIDSNNTQPQAKKVKIYDQSSPYKPTGNVDEQLLTSKLLIDLSGVLNSNFEGNVSLNFTVNLAYKETFTSPTPTFTFYYYSQNEINPDYLLGQRTVEVISKEMKTYTFSLNTYLKGNRIYTARSCNYDMGEDGHNILGMYLDYRTYSLNKYYVTVTV